MPETFDPYFKWLGIMPKDQPANHYRLLGIDAFISDVDVIESAADRQMRHLRTFQTGPHARLSQRLLNEVSAARKCLLDPAAKRAYDLELRQKLNREETPLAGPRVPVPPTAPAAPARAAPAAPVYHASSPPPAAVFAPFKPAVPPANQYGKHGEQPRRRGPAARFSPGMIAVVVAGSCGMLLLCGGAAGLVVWARWTSADSAAADSADTDSSPAFADGIGPTPAAGAAAGETIEWREEGTFPFIRSEGGDLIQVPDGMRPYSWLLSQGEYGDVEVSGQFRVAKGGAGGVYLRVPPGARWPWSQGLEVHFRDDYSGAGGEQSTTGSVFQRKEPVRDASRPTGEWNDFRILCRGRFLSVEINGVEVLTFNLPASIPDAGHLGLDAVSGGITYRNVRVK